MRLVLTIIFCFATAMVQSQQDNLYLKRGDVLKGSVINVKQKVITFALNDGDTVQINSDKIVGHKAIGYTPGEGAFKHLADSLNRKYQRGPRLQVGLGVLHDDSGEATDFNGKMGLDISYRFSQYLQFGWGFAYHQYEMMRSIPVYFIYQGDLTFNKSSGPYYFVNIGKSTAWGNDECDCRAGSIKGGLYLSAGLGYRWDLGNNSFFVQGGWLQERMTTTFSHENFWAWESSFWGPANRSTIIRQKINSLNLILGINF